MPIIPISSTLRSVKKLECLFLDAIQNLSQNLPPSLSICPKPPIGIRELFLLENSKIFEKQIQDFELFFKLPATFLCFLVFFDGIQYYGRKLGWTWNYTALSDSWTPASVMNWYLIGIYGLLSHDKLVI